MITVLPRSLTTTIRRPSCGSGNAYFNRNMAHWNVCKQTMRYSADVCRESFEPKPRNAGTPERTITTVRSCPQLGHSIRKARAVDNNQDLRSADGTTVGIVGAWWNGGQAHVWKPTRRSRTGINAEWRGAGSLHPGGAQFTMADASVRFIAETIRASNRHSGQANNNNIWNALNTAAGSGGQGSFELIPTLD